jgi:hypothetical protein
MAWDCHVTVEQFEPTTWRNPSAQYWGKCRVRCFPWVFHDVIIIRIPNGPHVMMPVRPMIKNNELNMGSLESSVLPEFRLRMRAGMPPFCWCPVVR